MPTSRARFMVLQALNELNNPVPAPRDNAVATQLRRVRPVIRIGPEPDELLVLSNGAADLPFFPARSQRVLAHQSNYAIGATDTGANPIFPIFVVRFLNRHVDEFKRTLFK